ncbi:hypothetical protein BOTBODRAFT_46798 [Botryobasidium botryosum FD-172 SS1]|uniref:Uncharacterized protein n=1 Tax=Botryobasidium botryosum (strain FD-172 SS1) TaxID=930990 RepID=A0A067M8A8_BOTB1|nr:hypothetical protein BOTBODRAFT_46798 [Botryobasidium botryosum FD-172 SS1]
MPSRRNKASLRNVASGLARDRSPSMSTTSTRSNSTEKEDSNEYTDKDDSDEYTPKDDGNEDTDKDDGDEDALYKLLNNCATTSAVKARTMHKNLSVSGRAPSAKEIFNKSIWDMGASGAAKGNSRKNQEGEVISNTSVTVSGEGVSNADEDTPAVGAMTPNINVTGTSGDEASTSTAKAKTPSLNGDSPGSCDQTKDTGVESQVGTQLGSEPAEAEQRPRPKPQPKRRKAKEAGEAPQQLARATTHSQAKNVAAVEMSDGLRSSSRAKVPTEKGAAQSTAGRGRGGAHGRGRK